MKVWGQEERNRSKSVGTRDRRKVRVGGQETGREGGGTRGQEEK